MALSIKDTKTDRLARKVARLAGESITEAVSRALEERLSKLMARRKSRSLAEELLAIGRHSASLPILDDRTPDEIIGYDENGLPR
jgi:antitoxin VapB